MRCLRTVMMMNTPYLIGALLGIALLGGCTGSSDGDVEGAAKAASAVPKSANELPSNMTPEAKAAASAAIAQGQAMQQQANDPGRVRAMQEMKKQHGG